MKSDQSCGRTRSELNPENVRNFRQGPMSEPLRSF